MIKEQKWVQDQQKKHHRDRIIRLLQKNPMRFTDLLKETKYSPRGLTTMLKDLVIDNKIEKIMHEGKERYALTKKGVKSFREISDILFAIDQIQKDGGNYYQGYSQIQNLMRFCHLTWGIDDELVLDKNIDENTNPITKDFVADLQYHIFEKLFKNIKNKKIKLDKTKEGTIILGFTIDYKELVESIEKNSLQSYKKVTDEELGIFEIMDHGNITDDVITKFSEIMAKR